MGVYSQFAPRIFWDTNFARVLDIGWPLDNVKAGPTPRDGWSVARTPAGAEDAWIPGTDYTLEGDLRWIPGRDAISPKRTGWDGLNNDDGVAAWLTWMRNKNQCRFHPISRNLLILPALATDTNLDGVADGWAAQIDAGSAATFSMDAPNAAQVINATASTGLSQAPRIIQTIPGVMPGESLTASVEAKIDAPITNGAANIRIQYQDAAGIGITSSDSPGVSATAFPAARVSITSIAPAGTASARIECRIRANGAGLSGTARFRQVMVRRESTDLTFLDNPFWLVYLVDPMEGTPDLERDGSRILRLKFRSPTIAFTDY